MTQLSFKLCNACDTNNDCCCKSDLAYVLKLFVNSDINVELFGVKTGGNLANGQSLATGLLTADSVTDDIVTFITNTETTTIQTTVVSLCQVYAVKIDLTTDQLASLTQNICNNNKSCCCNEGLSTTLKKYENKAEEISIEIADSTSNNPQNFYVIKACNNIVLLEFTGGGGGTIISNGYVYGSMTTTGNSAIATTVNVYIDNLQGEINTNDSLSPDVPDPGTTTCVILPLCVISSITYPAKKND